SVTREQLSRAGDGEEKSPRSVLKSLKHLISSDVRQALRKDPGWATVDTVLRRGVTRMGKTVENALRISVEGPTRVSKVMPGRRVDARLCRQQLRGVRHSCELAKSRLAYKPLYSVAESMEAFRIWYRVHHGMDSGVW